MQTWCEISGSAIQKNFEIFRELLKPSLAAPVLKSNAYGHGLAEVYRALEALKPQVLCVNYIFEARKLRELGFKERVLLVGPNFSCEFEEAKALDLEVTLGSETLFESWLASNVKPKIHIKFDTGLSRQGLYVEKAKVYAKKLSSFSSYVKGITSHFANVEDVSSQSFAMKQLQAFKEADEVFKASGLFSYEKHMSASAPSLLLKEARFDFCRIGISLYGFWPSPATKISFYGESKKLLSLEPALSWKTKIACLREIKKDAFVGYGCTYKAPKDMKIAVLPVGYYEGLPRVVSNSGAYVLCREARCFILGRICMNMSIIDVSHLEEVKEEDEVILIGRDGSESIQAEDLAGWCKTIQYETVTSISSVVPRKLLF